MRTPEVSDVRDIAARSRNRSRMVITLSAVVVLLAAVLALTFPGAGLNHGTAWQALIHPDPGSESSLGARVVYGWRLPRVTAGALIGAGLAVAGTLSQTLTRNPLGSPDIIGFNTGAYTGVIVVSYLGFSSFINVAIGALAGGGLTALIVMTLAVRRQVSGMRLILVGIGVSLTLAAVNRYLILNADLDTALAVATWAAGSLNGLEWRFVAPAAAILALVTALSLVLGPCCEALELADDTSYSTGLNVTRTRLLFLAISALLTSLCTALAGPISFVALAAPHLTRFLLGGQRVNLPATALTGATLVLVCDIIGQHLFPTVMLPVGVVTVTLGGVYLIALMLATSRASRR
ncbi:Ferric enterobactin transport system permease protein FepG [Corynebacterium confusum]|nr:Ferric enterobactin transport system permease protein FepG [Corynebacterium confusum]